MPQNDNPRVSQQSQSILEARGPLVVSKANPLLHGRI